MRHGAAAKNAPRWKNAHCPPNNRARNRHNKLCWGRCFNTAPRCGSKETAMLDTCVTADRLVFTLNRADNVCLMNRVHHELMFIIHCVIFGNWNPSAGLM
jgi:hypothetical protein